VVKIKAGNALAKCFFDGGIKKERFLGISRGQDCGDCSVVPLTEEQYKVFVWKGRGESIAVRGGIKGESFEDLNTAVFS